MAKARKYQISLNVTTCYHCVSRCVRRAYLCGEDSHTGKSYEHRRKWVEERLLQLASVFAIDIYAYAVMSNHLHVVLNVNTQQAQTMTSREVCERWHQLYKGTLLTQRYLNNESLTKQELDAVDEKLELWRKQLHDISWFMRALNEPIARQANAEDECTGRFWEGRFTSQPLLDERAIIACMAYVDLNPIRAKIADNPENSDHTSIQSRVKAFQKQQLQPAALAPFIGSFSEPNVNQAGIYFELSDYLLLVDWTGRAVRSDKRGSLDQDLSPILDRLGMSTDLWLQLTQKFGEKTGGLTGAYEKAKVAAMVLGYQRVPRASQNRHYFS
ncbi:transposase [Halioxenophilus aromaticivorans]|uniref:Transposase n=1 Tax=Halioxenophilus aromaticivorans TaxID=1306992 RepID=A0AAV3U5K4_9ALTE